MSKFVINKSTLTNIGDAVREKVGITDLIPVTELSNEILKIDTNPLPEGIVYTGDCSHIFNTQKANPHIRTLLYPPYINLLKLKDVTNLYYAFNGDGSSSDLMSDVEDLSPIEITIKELTEAEKTNPSHKMRSLTHAFSTCASAKKFPKISGPVSWLEGTLNQCRSLTTEELEKLFENIYPVADASGLFTFEWMLQDCYCLRSADVLINFYQELLELSPARRTDVTDSIYKRAFFNCIVLDSIDNIPVIERPLDTDSFYFAFRGCSRAKDITFNTKNGVPYVVPWDTETLDLSEYVGYAENGFHGNNMLDWGISATKKVTDAASYEALKNDADWYTLNRGYSRYNHDSAVNTINSLPDASAHITENSKPALTIKFESFNGTYTDGGAIGNLTEEEIAVAAAKGWTVTLR